MDKVRRQYRHLSGGHSGQALIEFVAISIIMLLLVFALIDFGRIIVTRQVMINISREGANLASRGSDFQSTLNAVVASANPLDINQNGLVILTSITRDINGVLSVTDQQSEGGLSSQSSKVAPGGAGSATINLPNNQIPPPNQVLIVAEVFHTYQPVTPLGKLMGISLPSLLYDVDYF